MAQGGRLDRCGGTVILVIDNYDSFVHNLARLVRLAGHETLVIRNDAIDGKAIEAIRPEAIVLSPGPGRPADAGCCIDVVKQFHESVPLLGVCLGHQAIVEALGGTIGLAPEPMHGHTSAITHNGDRLFEEVPSPFTVCRYHSLVASDDSLPACLTATARTAEGVIMAVEHRRLPIFGVQFHPEAVLTEAGHQLIDNFVRLTKADA